MMRYAAALVMCCILGLAACNRIVSGLPPTDAAASPLPAVAPPLAALPAALQAGRAVLVQGTGRTSGVPGFGRNAFPALSGVYLYQRGGTPMAGKPDTIAVWHTSVRLLVAPPWSAASCPGLPVEYRAFTAPAASGGATLWLLVSARYSLIAAMPPEVSEPWRFMAVFAERFSFFLRYSERPEDISFPATLEVGR